MTATTQRRPPFNPVDTSFSFADFQHGTSRQPDDVESPSLSSSNALARFEFEPGRSKDGTKVLMVEWEDDDATRSVPGDWEVSWEGKRTVLPARELVDGLETAVNRLYFLLGAGVTIPTTVRLQKGSVHWRTNPLPAIFSPELGATARQAGKRGVLHTIWAKKRLQVLQEEIEHEEKSNLESIGLEMAVAEKEWIERNFGVLARQGSISLPAAGAVGAANLNTPSSPRSPGGGRLMEKLRGLKLGTSEAELSANKDGTTAAASSGQPPPPAGYHNPLSPEGTDVAVGSFGSFAALKGMPEPSTLAAKAAQGPARQPSPQRIVAQRPPASFAGQQQAPGGGMGSLNAAFARNTAPAPALAAVAKTKPAAEGDEDELFALPMSPRSPEMAKSPFSFAAHDVRRVC